MKLQGRLQSGRGGSSKRALSRRLRSLTGIVILLTSCHDVLGQARKSTEYDLKAAYVYNFGKFVRWPASVVSAAGEFPLCVLGRNPFGPSLDNTVKGESIEGKSLSVRYMSSVSEANGCRILFVSESEEHRIESILAEVGKRPMLTVSDIPDFVDRGGDIEFVNVGEKIRFKVNRAAAEKSGLTLSSDLLKVAISVKNNGHSGE